MQNNILKDLNLQSNNFRYSFISARHINNETAIHQLRVSVKKIRAVIKYIISIYPENSSLYMHVKPLRKVFKYAASLRDVHIAKQLVSEIYRDKLSDNRFYNYLNKQEIKAKKTFKKSKPFISVTFSSLSHINRKAEQIFSASDRNELDQTLDKMIVNLSKALYQQLLICINEEDLHKLRIQLKSLVHLMTIRKDNSKQTFLEMLSLFADELGIWHDHIILSEHMKTYICKQRIVQYDMNELKNFLIFLNKYNKKISSEIKQNLKNYLLQEGQN